MIEWITVIGVFFMGCLFGSFFNVVGLRLPVGKSIVSPPSACQACGHRLGIIDLIPVVGWFVRGGRCHFCRQPISPIYMFGEIAAGVGYVLAVQAIGINRELVIALPVISILIILLVSDLKYRILPNVIIYPAMIGFSMLRLWHHPLPLWHYLAGFLIGGGLLYMISVVAIRMGKEAMGGGDIKLMALLGFVFGMQGIGLTLFFSSLLGCLIGGVLILIGRMGRKTPIPYGPFIAVGGIGAYLYGDKIMLWYLDYLMY